MEKLYKNKDWLENQYCEQQKSVNQIGREYNINHQTILNWMKRFNISSRSRPEFTHLSQANHCILSQEAIEFLNGELLGDAYMQGNDWSGRIGYTSKYEEYIEYISKIFKKFGIEQSGKIIKRINKQHGAISYSFTTKSYSELKSIYDKWYPEPERKKIIPKDIKLTPVTCRQWYIGDGCLEHRKKRSSQIILATCGFSVSDVNFLIKLLHNIGIKAGRKPSSNTIRISANPTIDFLNYIGKYPMKCYQYKWEV